VGGIPEIVDERCAVLTAPRDVAGLAKALEIALERDWNENVIAHHFRRSWEDMARELYDVCLSSLRAQALRAQSQSMAAQSV